MTSKRVVAVADGVGGWAGTGVDPAAYPRKLMTALQQEAQVPHVCDAADDVHGEEHAKWLDGMVERAAAAARSTVGSSTLVAAALCGKRLSVANLGDSGFLLYSGSRDGMLRLSSTPQTHRFNTPVQIGTSDDVPADRDMYSIVVESGDLLILATDGLFDNMYPEQVNEIVSDPSSLAMNAHDLATLLADEAARAGAAKKGRSPFGDEVMHHYGELYEGGKQDDVAVVVAPIVSDV